MKAATKVLCVCLAVLLLACCAKEVTVKNTFDSSMKPYQEMSDGTWRCEGYSYAKKLTVSGRMPNAAADSTFVYLTNLDDITFEQAYLAAGISSSTDDYFSPEDAVLVDMMTGQTDG